MKYLRCPDCGRKGVYQKLQGAEDHWRCRYEYLGCTFFAYDSGEDDTDIWNRTRLAGLNPSAGLWITNLGKESYAEAINRMMNKQKGIQR